MKANILAAVLLLASSNATATIYKCVDANGKQTYQQRPCPQATAESKVNAGPNWTLVKYDTYLEETPRKVGTLMRVMFKQTNTNSYDGRDAPNMGYVYYDCAGRSFAGPFYSQHYGSPRKLELSKVEGDLVARSGNAVFFDVEQHNRRGDRSNPFGEDEFVAFACADATPATSSVLMGSGPEREVYAATPQGVTVSDIAVSGDWVTIRGVAASTRNISDFMRNLEAGAFQSPSISKVAAGDFEIKALIRKR